ncbi:hypothetical protein GCM10012279_39510 [Micromonospora yangpuensis]|nr:hypothetical protein GCM10012279_39510 [Micromonospora yangpuensis]
MVEAEAGVAATTESPAPTASASNGAAIFLNSFLAFLMWRPPLRPHPHGTSSRGLGHGGTGQLTTTEQRPAARPARMPGARDRRPTREVDSQ